MTKQKARNITLLLKSIEVLFFYLLFYKLIFSTEIEMLKFNEPFSENIVTMCIFTAYAVFILLSTFYKWVIYPLFACETGFLIYLCFIGFYPHFDSDILFFIFIFTLIILSPYIPYLIYLLFYRKNLT